MELRTGKYSELQTALLMEPQTAEHLEVRTERLMGWLTEKHLGWTTEVHWEMLMGLLTVRQKERLKGKLMESLSVDWLEELLVGK